MNPTVRVKSVCVSAIAALLLFAGARTASAQTPAASQPNNKIALKKFVDAANNLPPEVKKHLSPALQNYLRYANAVVNAPAPTASAGFAAPQILAAASTSSSASPAADPNLIQVSSLALDPAKQGYTQNTTSSAWCGDSVVVGYEDSGAFLRSDPKLTSGVPISFNGVSFSTNAGKTFTDLGFLTPGTFFQNALLGDPVVTCTSPTHFQYVSILNTTTRDGLNNPIIGPSISFSTDAGKTWSAPQQIISLDGTTEMADKPWLAVDPGNPHRMYLTYTRITALGCTRVEVMRSADSGKIWSGPVSLNSDCNNPNIVMETGSAVIVSPGGKVYVAYESFPVPPNGASFGKNAIYFARSVSEGASFDKPVKIADVVPGGDGIYLNGSMQANDYPQLAVDRTTGASRGTIYITWPDGRNHVVPDSKAPSGTYAFPDIFVAKSTSFGVSFKSLGAISPTPRDFSGTHGRDQFLPTIAVDNHAEVAVCYYDRRDDFPANLRVGHFCSISANHGETWRDTELSKLDWVPVPNLDQLNTEGQFEISEYDSVASDFLFHSGGFFASFITEQTGKQSVVAKKF